MMQRKGIDFEDVMNNNKILLVKLSQGLIGEQNSYLLGTLIISKLNQCAQARQQLQQDKRVPFFLYIDEFQNFITDSLSSILSGARKYGLGLVLAHQSMEQVNAKDKEVAESILSNPYTRICFRLGDSDAKKLENSFASFESYDLQNQKVGEAIVRIGQGNHDGTITVTEIEKSKKDEGNLNLSSIREQGKQEFALSIDVKELIKETEKSSEIILNKESKENQNTVNLTSIQDKIIIPIEVINEVSNDATAQTSFLLQEENRRELRQHLALQTYIKKTAEGLGFKSVLEVATQDGGRIDVVLTYEQIKIAIEISVTNSVAYEIQNIQKCFRDGYPIVYMVSEDIKHLRAIRQHAISVIANEYHSHLHFMSKEECIEELNKFAQTQKQPIETLRGYRVKVKVDNSNTLTNKNNLLDDIVKSVKKK